MQEFEVTGRIVWGHPMKATPRLDDKTKQPIMKKDGSGPRMVRSFGLAVPVDQFQTAAWPAMYAEATSGFPNAVQMGEGFRWKYKTAQHFDKQGKPYSEREGYAGNVVLSVSSELDTPPPLYKQLPSGQFVQMGPDEIKCGDYVFCKISCVLQKPQNASHTPSLYINPIVLIFAGYGAAILSAAVDPNQLFAGRRFDLAPGASAQPLAPTMAASAPVPGQPQPAGFPGAQAAPQSAGYPGAQPGGGGGTPTMMQPQPAGYPGAAAAPAMAAPGFAPQPGAPATGYPSNPVQPAHGFVANAGQPQAAFPGAPQAQPQPGFPVPGQR